MPQLNPNRARLDPLVSLVLMSLSVVLPGCVGTPPVGLPIAARIVIVTGPSGSAMAGVPFAQQPAIQIADAAGNPVAARGVLITVTLASGGGAIQGSTSTRTDGSGRVLFIDLALVGLTGPKTLRFSASGLSPATSSEIILTYGQASAVAITAGSNQTVPAGTMVPIPPTIRVTDGSGNPVPGEDVTFSVAGGGGVVEGPVQTTDPDGHASVTGWTLGPAIGLNELTATVSGLTDGVSTFFATGVIGSPAVLAVVEGDLQIATIGSAVGMSPAVTVTDAFDNPIPGVAISFTVAAGGGDVTSPNPVSDADGVARLVEWRLGLVPGVNRLSAVVADVPAVTFTATAKHLAVVAIAAGGTHSCVATATDGRCWGNNTNGQFGDGTVSPDSTPRLIAGGLVPIQIGTGQSHSCLLTAAGAAHCWGLNTSGQLGDGSSTPSLVPVAVTGGHVFTQLAVGAFHACGLRADGSIYCWGAGGGGRLGYGGTQSAGIPQLVSGGFTFSSVTAGAAHSCAVRIDGIILCWGSNTNARLGDGTTADRLTPTSVSGAGVYSAVAAGGAHTCALDTTGAAWCWGLGSSGQLGTGSTPGQVAVPATVTGGLSFSAIAAGSIHSCGLDGNGAPWCWGSNGLGRLGDGTTVLRSAPVQVLGGLTFTSISGGGQHTCGMSTAGSALCWGRNAEGQLGDGTSLTRVTPVGAAAP